MQRNRITICTVLFLLISSIAIGETGMKQLLGPKIRYGGVLFRYYFPNASSVRIAGDFNEWTPNIELTRISKEGVFQVFIPILLKKNRYRYRLIIDGIWQKDPINNNWEYDTTGNQISFFNVSNNLITYGVNPEKTKQNYYKFYYKNSQAKSVYLVGSFNNFNPFENRMKKDQNGVWVTEVQIFPGKQYYAFVVDGKWIIDPTRIKTAYNRFDRHFSLFMAR